MAQAGREELWNQAFSLSVVWSTSSGHMLSGPGALPALSCWMVEYNFSVVKSPERSRSMLWALHRSETSLTMSQVNLYSLFLNTP